LITASPAFESKEHEKAWLIRVSINVCKNHLKHSRRKVDNIEDYSATLVCENGKVQTQVLYCTAVYPSLDNL